MAHCNDLACSDVSISTVSLNERTVAVAATTGRDGLGFIVSSHGPTAESQSVTRCSNADCSAASTFSLEFAGTVHSVAINHDGVPLYTYRAAGALRVVYCGSVTCTASTECDLIVGEQLAQESSITIGEDGLALISYFDQDAGDLRVAHCSDAECTTVTNAMVDSEGRVVGQKHGRDRTRRDRRDRVLLSVRLNGGGV